MSRGLQESQYYVSPDEYLAAERVSEVRHEYLTGAVYAMAGGSREHARVVTNITAELHNQLRGKRCEAFSHDMKVLVPAAPAKFYYYPNVVVDCSGAGKYAVEQPVVIFEVLSPETERIDVGEKLTNYRSLPSLRVYVLVNQLKSAVTVYRRVDAGWQMEFLGRMDAILELPEIECRLPLAALYERVEFA